MKRKGQGGFIAVVLFLALVVGGIIAHATMDWTSHEEPEWYSKTGDVEVNMSDKVIRNAIDAETGDWMYNFYEKKRTFSKDVFQEVAYKYSSDKWISYQYYDSETGVTTVELYKYEGTLSHSQWGDVTPTGCPVNQYCEGVKN